MIEFRLPSLGADMDRAKLNLWLVSPGDTVRPGQIIAEVETEKAVLEVECWDEGVVEELLVEPGPDWLEVGTVLAHLKPLTAEQPIEAAGAPAAAVSRPEPARPMPPRPTEATPPVRHLAHQLGVDLGRVLGTGPGGSVTREDVRSAAAAGRSSSAETGASAGARPKASPLARSTARRRGVDLTRLEGSGHQGMITAHDVEAVAMMIEAEPEDKLAVMRRAIARSMAHSKREIPHYYLATTIDLDRALRWLDTHNESRPIKERILPAAMLLKATALALRANPELNGHWVDDRFVPAGSIHLGVAISLRGGGLVAPAIHDADQLDLAGMMDRLTDLVARARSWRLRSSEMSDPTVTVTNLGDRGVAMAFPVIIPPQVAMVGFGKITDEVVARDGEPVVHPVVVATLAGDHRVTDGHRGGLLLAAIDQLVQEPEAL